MHTRPKTAGFALIAAAIALLALTACADNAKEGPAEQAGEQIDETAGEIQEGTSEALEETGEAIEEGADAASEAVDDD